MSDEKSADINVELQALNEIAKALERVDSEARRRIIDWVVDFYGIFRQGR